MRYIKYVSGAMVAAAFAVLAVAGPLSANAQTTGNVSGSYGAGSQGGGAQAHMGMRWGGGQGGTMSRPAVVGKVTAIDGDSLTVTQGARPAFGPSTTATATTTYTVDATNATVMKDNATSSVSSIAVGDMVAVQGTVSGTDVTATSIRDGFAGMGMGGGGRMGGMRMGSSTPMRGSYASSTSPITGNGQPVIAGTISAINGTSLTVTNRSGVTYTVDASNAKIVEGQNTVSASNLSVGDNVIIQGSVDGTSVTASSVIDQKAMSMNGGASSTPPRGGGGGIFGAIGGFFSRIFGF